MNTPVVVAMAVAAFAGSLVPSGVGLWVPLALFGIAAIGRMPLFAIAAIALLCSSLAAASWAGLATEPPGVVDGSGQVVTDPVRIGAGTRAVLRVDGARYLATGYGAPGAHLSRAQAGDRVEISGKTRAYTGPRERRATLHVGRRLALDSVVITGDGGILWRSANRIRSLVATGAVGLDPERRALFTGIVYGDDRGQSPLTEADFRLAGLTHLLAVSGQNVAYLLVVCRPMIERRSLVARWSTTVVVLLFFAAVTRFEPSVLRATMMAGLAVTARTLGQEATSARLLALAIVMLLVIDPLLAETVAFRLSVAASAGIVALSPAITRAVPGPTWFRESMAVTVAAQLAVAPVLVLTFGPISLVSIPANIAAGPVAGFLMGWGMTAGLAAGAGPHWLAELIHTVTRGGLWTLESIARTAAAIPIAPVGLAWIGLAVLVVSARAWWSTSGRAAFVAGLAAVTLGLALLPGEAIGTHPVGYESRVEVGPAATTLVLARERDTARLLEDLYRLGIRHVDTAIVNADAMATLDLVEKRIRVDLVVSGPGE